MQTYSLETFYDNRLEKQRIERRRSKLLSTTQVKSKITMLLTLFRSLDGSSVLTTCTCAFALLLWDKTMLLQVDFCFREEGGWSPSEPNLASRAKMCWSGLKPPVSAPWVDTQCQIFFLCLEKLHIMHFEKRKKKKQTNSCIVWFLGRSPSSPLVMIRHIIVWNVW